MYVECPTCADDTALIHSNSVNLQAALNSCSKFAAQERFDFSCKKSKILVYDISNRNNIPKSNWKLNENFIETVKSQGHLGLVRDSSSLEYKNSDRALQIGRRTCYSLFGAGLHGLNGLNPKTSFHIWNTYIVPRIICGLEVTINPPSEIELIEDYQRKTLKQLQNLPQGTSNSATYLLSGIIPIEAVIDQKVLMMFLRFVRDNKSAEHHRNT